MYHLKCPFCDKHYKLPRDKIIKNAGKSIHCRACGKLFVLPTPEADERSDEPLVETPPLAPETEHSAAEERVVAEPHAVESPADKIPVDEPPIIEPPVPVHVAADDTFEPPPLSEYSESPVVEAPEETPDHEEPKHFAEDIDESEAPNAFESFSESTEEKPHLSSEADDEEPGAAIDEKPPRSAAILEKRPEVEPPPPQLPPVPVSSPALPKPRRNLRASVAPVFVPEEEEPQPRRRSRFALRSEPVAPVEKDIEIPDVAAAEPAIQPPPTEFAPPDVETIRQEKADENETFSESKSHGDLSPEDEDTARPPVTKEYSSNPSAKSLATALPMLTTSTESGEDLAAIRRSVGLLAIMSVIITVVLIAILLASVGIIPKK